MPPCFIKALRVPFFRSLFPWTGTADEYMMTSVDTVEGPAVLPEKRAWVADERGSLKVEWKEDKD